MAAFQIFEDRENPVEKENRVHGGGIKMGVGKAALEKRSTLAVLNNVIDRTEMHSEKPGLMENARINLKNVGKSASNDENAFCFQQQKKAAEPFKGFAVYEDAKKDVVDHAKVEIPAEIPRNPLHELKSDTPMSVSGIMSPMSVDTSIVIPETPEKLLAIPRNDRERFFEVPQYQHDILAYLKEAELKHRPKPGYMRKQPDITHSMRTILVDWLVEVCEEYRLQNETLCLAISYIDRFLSYMSVVRAKLQLVGTAAMFIAAKYEEIYPPDVGEFVYITDDTYSRSQVLKMEQLILKVLSFDLTVPTALVFTQLYCIMNEIPDKVKFLTMYLCELSLLEADPYLQYHPSKISAAALAVARHTLDMPMWSKSLEEEVGYTLDDLKEIIMHLNKSFEAAAELGQQAIQEKYKSSKFHSVSQLKPSLIEEATFTSTDNDRNVRKMISHLAV
ncbi:G2/mitotic-specific cyclin-A [Culicoides brevitarsis]|uniref:G2/mitotic-specific cyclin-A n=1 Tax=Culicoides brevitarsis TaxID=469753 RepID=UPI00307B208A